jgi:hypothetical protein
MDIYGWLPTNRLDQEQVLCQGEISMEDEAQSYWRATAKPFAPPPAELPSRTDVVVVGAGSPVFRQLACWLNAEPRSPFSMPKAWDGAHPRETAV